MKEEMKRLFFGVEVHAPWPPKLPLGRMLDASHRHITLAFLGNIPLHPLQDILSTIPIPTDSIGLAGEFDICLLLPPHRPNVVAWHAKWREESPWIVTFQHNLSVWLSAHHYSMDKREWMPHTTLCRKPFDPHAWKKTFTSLPFYLQSIHLYESIGNLTYIPIWSYPVLAPFEEIDHTADMAFIVRGKTFQQLYHNAFTALAFRFPSFLNYFAEKLSIQTIDDVIIGLNQIIGEADAAMGCPFKAVSFHGEAVALQNETLQWEMIVDV